MATNKKDEKALEHFPHEPTIQDPNDNPPVTKLAADELVEEQKPEGAQPELPKRKPSGTVRGRVWEHGSVHHDGKVYAAGTIADLPEEFATQLGKAFTPE